MNIRQSPEWIDGEDLEHVSSGRLKRNHRLSHLTPQPQQRRLIWLWYALKSGYRSYRAHKSLLFAKGEAVVDYGPALLLLDGHLVPNKRTNTRSLGARTMRESHPWANTTDLLIYLEGFDAGELYAASIYGTQDHTTPQDLTCETPAL